MKRFERIMPKRGFTLAEIFAKGRVGSIAHQPKKGFTLAEMLVVLMIVSLVAMSAIPFAHKKFRILKGKTVHGKYECYWDDSGNLVEKEWRNSVLKRNNTYTKAEYDAGTKKCTFTPPSDASYFIAQAIGGGGGGAYAGTINNTVTEKTQDGNIIVPINGDPITSSYGDLTPTWVTNKLATNAYYVVVTVYGGGGGGGHGNMSSVSFVNPTAAAAAGCTADDNFAYPSAYPCRWQYASTPGIKTGGNGGNGSSGYRQIIVILGKKILATSGDGGAGGKCNPETTAGSGTSGIIKVNNTSMPITGTNGGGGGGGNAPTTDNGSPGSISGTGDGGAGGAGNGMTDPSGTSGKPAIFSKDCLDGSTGGTRSPIITNSNAYEWTSAQSTITNFPFKFTYGTKSMPYGEAGEPGDYQNMFFRKLSNDLIITPGEAGEAGTAATDYNADGIKGDGESGGASKISTLVNGLESAFLTADGGEGGDASYSLSDINLYEVYASATYRSTLLSSATGTVTGTIDGSAGVGTFAITGAKALGGSFVMLKEDKADDDDTDFATFGAGGDGGGSWTGVKYTSTKYFNNENLSTEDTPSSSATSSSAGGLLTTTAGKAGAVVILW